MGSELAMRSSHRFRPRISAMADYLSPGSDFPRKPKPSRRCGEAAAMMVITKVVAGARFELATFRLWASPGCMGGNFRRIVDIPAESSKRIAGILLSYQSLASATQCRRGRIAALTIHEKSGGERIASNPIGIEPTRPS